MLGTKDELLHGEAIVIGMILESHISFQKKKLSKKELNEITEEFKHAFLLPSLETPSVLIVSCSVAVSFVRIAFLFLSACFSMILLI